MCKHEVKILWSQGTCDNEASHRRDEIHFENTNKKWICKRDRPIHWFFQLVIPVTKSISEVRTNLVPCRSLYPKNMQKKNGIGR